MENSLELQNNTTDLLAKINEQVSLFGSSNSFDRIATRATDEKLFELKSLNTTDLSKIADYMPEINRATNAFGKSQSQYMDLVMTVSNHQPLRNLRQILAEIENRRTALKENGYRLKRSIIDLIEKREKLANATDKYEQARLQIDIEELESGIADSRLYVEGALKTIYSYEQAYMDIKNKFGIENWDEKDFEAAEEEYHIKKAFEQAHADVIATGRITQGNHEYFRQIGINPQNALADLTYYMAAEEKKMKDMVNGGDNNPNIGILSFIEFMDKMAVKYKGCTKVILESKGINPEGAYDSALFKELRG